MPTACCLTAEDTSRPSAPSAMVLRRDTWLPLRGAVSVAMKDVAPRFDAAALYLLKWAGPMCGGRRMQNRPSSTAAAETAA
jgi:hypothetical protein